MDSQLFADIRRVFEGVGNVRGVLNSRTARRNDFSPKKIIRSRASLWQQTASAGSEVVNKPQQSLRLFQFNLRTLLGVFVFLSVCLALVAWDLTIGPLLSVAFAGLVLAGFGMRQRRVVDKVCGIAMVAIVGLAFFVDMSGGHYWDGSFTLNFDVTVFDDESGEPVPDADIAVEYHGIFTAINAYNLPSN